MEEEEEEEAEKERSWLEEEEGGGAEIGSWMKSKQGLLRSFFPSLEEEEEEATFWKRVG